MSRQFRYRATGIALVALFAMAPLLATDSAHAEQVAGDQEVVFGGGGVLGLSCVAQPNVEAMRVPAGGTLRVINRTGHRAELRLNGASQGQLVDRGATQVVFRRGTVEVTMEPDCVLRDTSAPVLVTASPSIEPSTSPGEPRPTVAPPTSDSAAPPPSSSPASTAPVSSPAAGSPSISGSPASTTTRPSAAGTVTRPGTSAATTAVPSLPRGDATTAVRTTTTSAGTTNGGTTTGGTTAAASTATGTPPGDDPSAGPGVPSVDVLPATDQAPVSAAAEPVAALKPITHQGPDGLLAVIATVCVLGVGAGAIRAFVAERASRTSMA